MSEEKPDTDSIESVNIKSEPPDEAAASGVIKQEVDDIFTPEVSISYDVPELDLRSSLQEEVDLKEEILENFEAEAPKESVPVEIEVKIEQISEAVPQTEQPESTTENTMMEPVPYQMTELYNYSQDIQLNSITGDMLSLEQEAKTLLKAKKEIVKFQKIQCTKCSHIGNTFSMMRHMKVHIAIENRKNGMEKGKKTRELNKILKQSEPVSKVVPVAKKQKIKCNLCNKSYAGPRSLRRHQRSCMKEDVVPTVKTKLGTPVKTKVLTPVKLKVVTPDKPEVVSPIKPKLVKHPEIQIPSPVLPVVKRTRSVQENPIIARKNGQYTCECGKVFTRRSPMETCLRSHHPEEESEVFKCATCAKTFPTKLELSRHRKIQHVKKKFLCKFCPMDYHTYKELFQHLRAHKKVQLMEYKAITEVVKGKQALKCFICKKTFKELSNLKAHVLVDHKEPYTCPICKEEFHKIVDFATHIKSAHPEIEGQSALDVLEAFSILAQAWKCEECDLQFEDPDKLVIHQREQHGPMKKATEDEITKFLFRCEDCRRMFATLKQLTSHKSIHYIEETQEPAKEEVVVEKGPPLPMCVHCRKVCKDEETLTSHLRLHSMERKYPCKFCDFRFATIEKRKNHSTIHTGDMKFVCFICEYRCTSENRLNLHKQSPKHLMLKEQLLNGPPFERPATPPVVPEKKKRHSSETRKSKTPVDVPCDICGEIFTSEEDMLKHKDTHPFIVFPNEDEPTRIFFK